MNSDMTKRRSKQHKQSKNNSASITHTENDLWRDLTYRTKEKYNRVNCGKGSVRRIENTKLIHSNWDEIKWSNNSDK